MLACHEDTALAHIPHACHACGGPKDTDKRVRELMGCDGPARRMHQFYIGQEMVETRECPRKMMAPAVQFIRAYNWAEKGRLDHLYRPGEMPAFVGEAIDLIAKEMYKIHVAEMEKIGGRGRG